MFGNGTFLNIPEPGQRKEIVGSASKGIVDFFDIDNNGWNRYQHGRYWYFDRTWQSGVGTTTSFKIPFSKPAIIRQIASVSRGSTLPTPNRIIYADVYNSNQDIVDDAGARLFYRSAASLSFIYCTKHYVKPGSVLELTFIAGDATANKKWVVVFEELSFYEL